MRAERGLRLLAGLVTVTVGFGPWPGVAAPTGSPVPGASGVPAPSGSTVGPGAPRWALGPLQAVSADVAWVWLAQAPTTSGRPYAEEVALTLDGGRSWLDRTPPGLAEGTDRASVTQVVALDAADAWVSYGGLVSGAPQALMGTEDGGRHWAKLGPLPSPYCSLQFVSATVGWCTVSLAAMGNDPVAFYRSADAGRHWYLESRSASVRVPGTAGSLPAGCDKLVRFNSGSQGLAAFVCGAGFSPIYDSTDAGRRWARVDIAPLPPGYHLASGLPAAWLSAPVTSGLGGAVGLMVEGLNESLVYDSTDGGSTWRPVAPPGQPRPWHINIVSPSIWKLTYGGTVLTTTDAGHSWKSARSDLALPAQALEYVTADDGWDIPIAGDELQRTQDGGVSWQQVRLPAFPQRHRQPQR